MKSLPREAKEFLSRNNIAHIATVSKKNGYPYITTVFYHFDDKGRLYFISREGQKIDNIHIQPRVGISISSVESLIILQMNATATIIEETKDEKKLEIMEKLVRTSEQKIQHYFAPVAKSGHEPLLLVSCVINWFRLSFYHGRQAAFLEGRLK